MNDFQSDIDAINRIDAIPLILDVVCRTTGLGFAAVARVTHDRWITCKVLDKIDFGLGVGDELEVETTLCHEIRQHKNPVVINHVAESAEYRGHHTPLKYGFQSYISVPIILGDGQFFGTLCAIDPRPAQLENAQTIGMFTLFAQLIASQLNSDDKLMSAERQLFDEQKMAEIREQFIAILGHDLRNPLGSIQAGVNVLSKTALEPRAEQVLDMMKGSVRRMASLVDNLMDFARGRLGGGLALRRQPDEALEPVLVHVVNEVQSTHPDARIETHFTLTSRIDCDPQKIGQMLSNLLGNAVTHGARGEIIRVTAADDGERFELAVHNKGPVIAPDAMRNLFQPFFRGGERSSQGLGLGLYIASEIAKGHGGTLKVESSDGETVFRFAMEQPAQG